MEESLQVEITKLEVKISNMAKVLESIREHYTQEKRAKDKNSSDENKD